MKATTEKEERYCRNCHYPMPALGNYCSNCSQKFTTGKITLGQLLHDFFEAVFNIDSKIFRTLGALFIPGKLTKEYFQGRHQRYLNPLRLFFIMAIVQVATISFLIDKPMNKTLREFEGTLAYNAHEAIFIDSLKSARRQVLDNFGDDSLVKEALDSLSLKFKHDSQKDTLSYGYFRLDKLGTKEVFREVRIAAWDLLDMEEEALLEAYEVNDFWGKLTIGQIVKINKEGVSFLRFLIGQIVWMILAMMVALAFILKLLYIRRKKYYVEHLIFSFHYHAFAFLVCSVGLIIDFAILKRDVSVYGSGALILSLIYLYWAMKWVYQQGYIKTFFKYWILNFFYLFIFGLFLVLTFIVSAIFY